MSVNIVVLASQTEPIPVRVKRPEWSQFLEY